MDQKKSDREILAEIYRNAQLAITSISDIMPAVGEGDIREEIMREHEEYEKICSKAAKIALKYDVDLKEPNPIKKAIRGGSPSGRCRRRRPLQFSSACRRRCSHSGPGSPGSRWSRTSGSTPRRWRRR